MKIRDRNICIWCDIKEGCTQQSVAVKYNTTQPSVSRIYGEMENKLNTVIEYEETEGFV
jgi:hypothetical protein